MLQTQDVLWRYVAAFAAGAIMGMERQSRGRAAGLRTTILACLASASAMMISQVLFAESSLLAGGNWRPDPARLGAGILTGIGFLGAGTILRNDNMISGVTTAASLWFVTVLGLAFGSGLFFIGATGLALGFVTLVALPALERFIRSDCYVNVEIITTSTGPAEETLCRKLDASGVQVRSLRIAHNLEEGRRTFTYLVRLKSADERKTAANIVQSLADLPGVQHVNWR